MTSTIAQDLGYQRKLEDRLERFRLLMNEYYRVPLGDTPEQHAVYGFATGAAIRIRSILEDK